MHEHAPSRRLEAACHCGNIRVAIDWSAAWPAIPVRACGCDFCRKHAARWTSDPNGAFRLMMADAAGSSCYRFGSHTADFHVCGRCGVIPIVTSLLEGRRYAVFNANTFVAVDGTRFVETATDFEAETLAERLARRRRNSTPEAGSGDPSLGTSV